MACLLHAHIFSWWLVYSMLTYSADGLFTPGSHIQLMACLLHVHVLSWWCVYFMFTYSADGLPSVTNVAEPSLYLLHTAHLSFRFLHTGANRTDIPLNVFNGVKVRPAAWQSATWDHEKYYFQPLSAFMPHPIDSHGGKLVGVHRYIFSLGHRQHQILWHSAQHGDVLCSRGLFHPDCIVVASVNDIFVQCEYVITSFSAKCRSSSHQELSYCTVYCSSLSCAMVAGVMKP